MLPCTTVSSRQAFADERLSPLNVYVSAKHILGCLSAKDLARAALVCKIWNDIAREWMTSAHAANATLWEWKALAEAIGQHRDAIVIDRTITAREFVEWRRDKEREFAEWRATNAQALSDLQDKSTYHVWFTMWQPLGHDPYLPSEVGHIPNRLAGCTALFPKWVEDNEIAIRKVDHFFLSDWSLTFFPDEMRALSNLRFIDCHDNLLTTFPQVIGSFTALEKLDLSFNRLTSISSSINNLIHLKELCLNNNRLTSLPEPLALTRLKQLELNENNIASLPESLGNLVKLKNLSCNGNRLSSIPQSIGMLTHLQILSFDNNRLSSIPESIGRLSNLRGLSCGHNRLHSIPEAIGNLTRLEVLLFNDNRISSLPLSIGNLTTLEELDMRENQIPSLPDSIRTLENFMHWVQAARLQTKANFLSGL